MTKKAPQVRLEPCDLPTEAERPKTFSLQRRDGQVVHCWLCDQRVATKTFENRLAEPGCSTSVDLCQTCCELQHSNAAFFPSQYPNLVLLRDLLRAMRSLVKVELLRGRAS